MRTTNIAELKNNLSSFLADVKRGEEILISDRNKPIAKKILAPRLFYAGTVLIGEMPPRKSSRWSGISTVVKTTEEARKAVETLVRAGVDYIKAEKRALPDILKEIIRAVHKYKLPVVAVLPSFVIDASNDGLDCVEHFAEIHRETSKKLFENSK